MGLDSIELLMLVEKHFNITIPDSEAEEAITPKILAKVIRKYITLNPESKCKSQVLFYVLRIYFKEQYQFEQSLFKPTTHLTELFPQPDSKERWRKMETDFDIILPKLTEKKEKAGWVSLLSPYNLQSKKAIIDYQVRDLVEWILSINHHDLINKSSIFSDYEIERIVIGITSDFMGIPIEEINPDSKFVEDLGIDA